MLLTTKQVQKRLGISQVKVRSLIRTGRLHGIDTSIGQRAYWMVPEESVEAFERGEAPAVALEPKKPTRTRRIDADVPKVFG